MAKLAKRDENPQRDRGMYKDPFTTAVRCDSRCDSNRHTITPDKLPVVLQLEYIWFRFKAWTGTIAAMLKYLDQESLLGQLISAEASLEDIIDRFAGVTDGR
jgi:hypothetical protein